MGGRVSFCGDEMVDGMKGVDGMHLGGKIKFNSDVFPTLHLYIK